MTANVINRQRVRELFAALLETALVGSGKPAQAVYDHQVGDFHGKSPAVIVTSAGTGRGSSLTSDTTEFLLDVHTFVLYALEPWKATNSPNAGSNRVINIQKTHEFEVGGVATVEDENNSEVATITAISPNASITVAVLVHSYTTPNVHAWTESQSEDRLDLLEKSIAEVIIEANLTMGMKVEPGGQSEIDGLEIGGNEYRHEVIPVLFTEWDF